MAKIKIEDIQLAALDMGWKVISEEYKNLNTEMEFLCPEGHKIRLPWKTLRNNFECPQCKQNQIRPKKEIEILPKTCKQRIIGIDQATHITGFAVIDDGKLVRTGIYEASGEDEVARCHDIKLWLISLIQNWRPDYIGFEGIQFQENSINNGQRRTMGVTVFQALARLQGILMETAYELNIPFEVCPTNTWRNHCGVKGKTRNDKKRSMQLIVKEKYNVTVSDDIADSIGIATYMSDRANNILKTEEWV